MPFRPIEKFADVNPVNANGTASASLTAAGVYHTVLLRCLDSAGAEISVANMKEDIKKVRITINGVNHYEPDGDLLFDLQELYYAKDGASPVDGIVPIQLSPHHLENVDVVDNMGYGMAGVTAFQLEVEFGPDVGTAGHTSQVQVYTERPGADRPLGTHRRLISYERSFASAGVQEVNNLPIEPDTEGVVTNALHIQHDGTAARINNVEVKINNQVVMNVKPSVVKMLMERAGRKWMDDANANSLFSIPFDLIPGGAGYLSHVGVFDLRLNIEWSAAPSSFTIYRESTHGVGSGN